MKRTAVLAILLLSAGCSQKPHRSSPDSPPARPAERAQAEPLAHPTPASLRMVIRTATLSLVVDDAAGSLRAIVAAVESHGGYLVDMRQWHDGGQVRAVATLRVPSDKLSAVLPEITKGALRVESETITGQDVSEEFSDLGAQLANLRATEVELRGILATVRERTQKASEVLDVYDQLARVRKDIDRLQGRASYLEQMTAMSTIEVELIPDLLSKPIVEPGWRPQAVAKNATRALVVALKWIATALIWLLVCCLPIGLVAVVLAILGRVAWRTVSRWGGGRRGPPPRPPTMPASS